MPIVPTAATPCAVDVYRHPQSARFVIEARFFEPHTPDAVNGQVIIRFTVSDVAIYNGTLDHIDKVTDALLKAARDGTAKGEARARGLLAAQPVWGPSVARFLARVPRAVELSDNG